jgi:HEAT repeat protein
MKSLRWIPWTIAVLVLGIATYLFFGGYDWLSSQFYSTRVKGETAFHWTKELESSDSEARLTAIQSLAKCGDEAVKAVPSLAKILNDSKVREERIEAAFTLGKLVPPPTEKSPDMAKALKEVAVPALAKALSDQDDYVRVNAASALSYLASYSIRVNEPTCIKEAIPALKEALKDKHNGQTRLNMPLTPLDMVLTSLSRATRGTDEAVPDIVEALKAYREENKHVKIQTIQTGGKSTKENPKLDNEATLAAKVIRDKVFFAQALAEIGPPAKPAVDLLRQMIKEDPVSDFKVSAKEALEKIEGKGGKS